MAHLDALQACLTKMTWNTDLPFYHPVEHYKLAFVQNIRSHNFTVSAMFSEKKKCKVDALLWNAKLTFCHGKHEQQELRCRIFEFDNWCLMSLIFTLRQTILEISRTPPAYLKLLLIRLYEPTRENLLYCCIWRFISRLQRSIFYELFTITINFPFLFYSLSREKLH